MAAAVAHWAPRRAAAAAPDGSPSFTITPPRDDETSAHIRYKIAHAHAVTKSGCTRTIASYDMLYERRLLAMSSRLLVPRPEEDDGNAEKGNEAADDVAAVGDDAVE